MYRQNIFTVLLYIEITFRILNKNDYLSLPRKHLDKLFKPHTEPPRLSLMIIAGQINIQDESVSAIKQVPAEA